MKDAYEKYQYEYERMQTVKEKAIDYDTSLAVLKWLEKENHIRTLEGRNKLQIEDLHFLRKPELRLSLGLLNLTVKSFLILALVFYILVMKLASESFLN